MSQPRHYVAAVNILKLFNNPVDILKRYLLGSGVYPFTVSIKTPIGLVNLTLYSYHDLLTLNEIFCREDYFCKNDIRTVVDFGSNIGISALYFLTRNRETFVYLFEPLAVNCQRMRQNLEYFQDRFNLSPVAVWLADGDVEFGYEETGRYGGVKVMSDYKIMVPAMDVNNILSNIIEKHTNIDILKIDIEGGERDILAAIAKENLSKINTIYIEQTFCDNLIDATHNYSQCYHISQFVRK